MAGHELVCPLRRRMEDYQGTRRERVDLLAPLVKVVPNCVFGADSFLNLAGSQSWDALCHHAAEVANYKSPDFDPYAALRNNTLNIQRVLGSLRTAGAPVIVVTGTVFESEEGLGDEPRHAFSPYGLSKRLTWEVFSYYCQSARMPLSKFVIPNPFGPFEEERFTSYLMNNWRQGKPACVRTPDYVRDNIPVDLLSKAYRVFIEKTIATKAPVSRLNPSGYVSKQGEFAERVARETKTRLGWRCELDLQQQTDFSEPLVRTNSDPAIGHAPDWNETAFWDAFCDFYARSSRV
jgi:nucleoside-diphosphate-sugar epimerase